MPVVDCIHRHRETQRIAEQDELLALVMTEMAGTGQEAYGELPFLLGQGQADILGKGILVLDKRRQDFGQTRGFSLGIGRIGGMIGPAIGGAVLGADLAPQWNFYIFACVGALGCLLALLTLLYRKRAD